VKKRLSAYWWCQIIGWSICAMIYNAIYFFIPRNLLFNNLLSLYVGIFVAVFGTHLIRAFIIKMKLLELHVAWQIVYIFFSSILFALVYSVFIAWLIDIFQWQNKSVSQYSLKDQLIVQTYTDIFILALWNLIYFAYHYIEKSYRHQIDKIRLESKLKVQQLESIKQLAEFEMQALRAKMNPHFIFNSLNSISRFILKNQKTEANDYLTKFSKLIRMTLQNSELPTVKLKNELNMLQLYLELECLRFDKKIMYEFQCDPDLDTELIEIPPLLLQPYVENAIHHGLMLKKERGHLWIEIKQKEQYLVCSITDDGIGRKKAAELKNATAATHKSMSMNITASRIALLNQSKQFKSGVKIVDLVLEDGSPGGTQVIINLPLMYN